MLKKIVTATICSVLILVCNVKVTALDILKPASFDVDTTLLKQDDNFGSPQTILITPIFLSTDQFISDEDWYKGLYYYQVARLQMGDQIFHYVMLNDGTIIEGNTKGEEQRFSIAGENKPIIVAYFAKADDQDFSFSGKAALSQLVLDIANRNHLEPSESSIKVKNIEFVADQENKVSLSTSFLGGRWERSIKSIINTAAQNYKPIKKSFKLVVEKIELPKNKVNYGDNIVAKITVKNNSKFSLYQGSDFEPVISKISGDFSLFYVNGIWLSLTQAPLMTEGSIIRPGESVELQLRLGVPLYFDKQSEQFQLIDLLGNPYAGTQFTISLDVNRTTQEVVEITQTETGQLNVRLTPSYYAEIIAKATPGQRFIVLERNSSGWLKIDMGNGTSGWVLAQYTKVV